MKIQFSPQMVLSGVKNFKYVYPGFGIVSLVWSVWVLGFLLWVLICGLVEVLFLSCVVNF